MLRDAVVEPRRFSSFRRVLPPGQYRQVRSLAEELRGRSVVQVNSTAEGGGVAELLRSTTPLLQDLGLDATWKVLQAPREFFEASKRIHNGLQGAKTPLSEDQWRLYERVNRSLAARMLDLEADIIVVHDPQPAAARAFMGDAATGRWVWRCHIDLSSPNGHYASRIARYTAPYDAAVFSMPQYLLPGLRPAHSIILPAIDPMTPKNRPMRLREARLVVKAFGLDPERPLITQVSRFDTWKDAPGVVAAWKVVRREHPGVQLALVGSGADDDPEGAGVVAQLQRLCIGLRDVHILYNRADDRAVNAFQTASDVVLQKSLREGFGLTVSEALWSGTPVVGGDVGGIPSQIRHGRCGFLVRSPQEAARRVSQLLSDHERRFRMGLAGRERVRQRFLLPRMLADELRLWRRLLRLRR